MRILWSILLSCRITGTSFLHFVRLLYSMYASVFLPQSETSFPYHILTSLPPLCHRLVVYKTAKCVKSSSLQEPQQRSWVWNWFSCPLTFSSPVRTFLLQTCDRDFKSWWKILLFATENWNLTKVGMTVGGMALTCWTLGSITRNVTFLSALWSSTSNKLHSESFATQNDTSFYLCDHC